MASARSISSLIATVLVAAVIAPAGTPVAPPDLAGLYFVYTMNCTFTVQNDSGNVVTSIAPGKYDVTVRTPIQFGTVPLNEMTGADPMTACKGMVQFQLTGPGINLNTTLLSGCGQDQQFTETFLPSSTYTAQDNNQASATRTTFTTAATGSPTPPPAIATGPNAAATQSSDIVGSGAKGAVQGTLTARLLANGALTLMENGKAVSKLEAGKYRVTIADRSAKGGVTVQSAKLGSSTTLTTPAFVGTKTTTLILKAGTWTYYSGLGKIHRFVVSV
jgi:hypothetical protein